MTRLAPVIRAFEGWLRRHWYVTLACGLVVFVPGVSLVEPGAARSAAAVLIAANAGMAALAIAVMVFVLDGLKSERLRDGVVVSAYRRESDASGTILLIFSSFGGGVLGWLLSQPSPRSEPFVEANASLALIVVTLNLLMTLMSVVCFFIRAERLARHDEAARLYDDAVSSAVLAAFGRYVERTTGLRRQQDQGDSVGVLATLVQREQEGPLARLLERHFDTLHDDVRQDRLVNVAESFQLQRRIVSEVLIAARQREFRFAGPAERHDFGRGWPPFSVLAPLWQGARELMGQDSVNVRLAREVVSFDYWLLQSGLRWRNAQLFENGFVALLSEQPAVGWRLDGGSGDNTGRAWRLLAAALQVASMPAESPSEAEPAPLDFFAAETVAWLTLVVSLANAAAADALAREDGAGFEAIVRDSGWLLRELESLVRFRARGDRQVRALAVETYAQVRRISLMALAGRAILIREGQDPTDYLRAIRAALPDLGTLGRDVDAAFDSGLGASLGWIDWEMSQLQGRSGAIDSSRYLLTGFAVLALDRSDDAGPLTVREAATRLIRLLEQDGVSLVEYSLVSDKDALPRLLGRVKAASDEAELEFQRTLVAAPLDSRRVANFVADVYCGRFRARVIEPLFEDVETAFQSAREVSDGTGASYLLDRLPFVDLGVPYFLLGTEEQAEGFEEELIQRVVDAVPLTAELMEEATAEIVHEWGQKATEALGIDDFLIILSGAWTTATAALRYEARAQGIVTRARGYSRHLLGHLGNAPIVELRGGGPPRLTVIDRRRWGCIERLELEGEPLTVKIEGIDVARAQRLRADWVASGDEVPANADEHLIALQAQVLITVRESIQIHVKDPVRAFSFQFAGPV